VHFDSQIPGRPLRFATIKGRVLLNTYGEAIKFAEHQAEWVPTQRREWKAIQQGLIRAIEKADSSEASRHIMALRQLMG
jgi:hypothetical protein